MTAASLARPQQARSFLTRRKLLSASVACLRDLGAAGTTTTSVCDRAGVSQGALFRHFPTKAALLAATAEHWSLERVSALRRAFAGDARESDRSAVFVGRVWEVLCDPDAAVGFELEVAARTDPALRESIGPALRMLRNEVQRRARALLPDVAAGHPRFEAAVDTLWNALRGAALARSGDDKPDPELAYLEDLARRELAPRA